MSNIDQFESVFRSAIHDIYEYKIITFRKILIVTDLDAEAKIGFIEDVKHFLNSSDNTAEYEWLNLSGSDYTTTSELLEQVEKFKPDLIFTYRNLHSRAWKHPHSLGEYLDVLIQKTDSPVLILPHPHAGYAMEHTMKNCDVVMALTDHLSNNHDLVNYAVRFTQKKGALHLGHVEDIDTFNKYIDVISKIQSIDTDNATKQLQKELLKQPSNYINAVIDRLAVEDLDINVKSDVKFGHHLTEFKNFIDKYKVDLLVLNAKDRQQMAMHGSAYPLAVELRQIPLLMI